MIHILTTEILTENVTKMKQAKVVLDLEKYGKGLGLLWRLGWGWKFYAEGFNGSKETTDKEENTNFVTVSDSFFPHLYAVTEKQYKSWKKQKFFYKFRWKK